jgi:hypothetical protein
LIWVDCETKSFCGEEWTGQIALSSLKKLAGCDFDTIRRPELLTPPNESVSIRQSVFVRFELMTKTQAKQLAVYVDK